MAGRVCVLLACAAAVLALAGCGAADDDPAPDRARAGEARALEDAAEMLHERRLPERATPTSSPAPDATIQTGER